MVYIVDSHALVWFLEGNDRLGETAKAMLADPDARLVIPSIVLAEIAYLYNRKRIKANVRQVLADVASADNCTVYPLDERVAERIPDGLELHDAIVVATAIVYRDVLGEDVAVITKDASIANSGLVAVLW
ncbi:MAG: type II toxin-antitoxin system VapC family toxin [Chloroflexi bacterium]|nr:type II toxin-antitoxin system VapC family toxin [Chloroflexota bacterium]